MRKTNNGKPTKASKTVKAKVTKPVVEEKIEETPPAEMCGHDPSGFMPSAETDERDELILNLRNALTIAMEDATPYDPLYDIPLIGRALVINEWQRKRCFENPWLNVMHLPTHRPDGPDVWSVSSNDDYITLTLEKNAYVKDVGVQNKRKAESDLAYSKRHLKLFEEDPTYLQGLDEGRDMSVHIQKIKDNKDEIDYLQQVIDESKKQIETFSVQEWKWTLDVERVS